LTNRKSAKNKKKCASAKLGRRETLRSKFRGRKKLIRLKCYEMMYETYGKIK